MLQIDGPCNAEIAYGRALVSLYISIEDVRIMKLGWGDVYPNPGMESLAPAIQGLIGIDNPSMPVVIELIIQECGDI